MLMRVLFKISTFLFTQPFKNACGQLNMIYYHSLLLIVIFEKKILNLVAKRQINGKSTNKLFLKLSTSMLQQMLSYKMESREHSTTTATTTTTNGSIDISVTP